MVNVPLGILIFGFSRKLNGSFHKGNASPRFTVKAIHITKDAIGESIVRCLLMKLKCLSEKPFAGLFAKVWGLCNLLEDSNPDEITLIGRGVVNKLIIKVPGFVRIGSHQGDH